MDIKLRLASPSDAARLLEIYRPYVENTTISFEYEVPSEDEFRHRIEAFSAEFPYIVCEIDGITAGYAYAHRYKERFAYRFAAELSVYINERYHGLGLGKRLYCALTDMLCEMGYKSLYCIVTGENTRSLRFHEKLGFTEICREKSIGYKFGRWIDTVLYEKVIGERLVCTDSAAWGMKPKTVRDICQIVPILLAKYEKSDDTSGSWFDHSLGG